MTSDVDHSTPFAEWLNRNVSGEVELHALASSLGIHERVARRWLTGVGLPSPALAPKIAQYFGVDAQSVRWL